MNQKAGWTVLVWLALFLGGCQILKAQEGTSLVPIYANDADAQAVAAGQFGAVPIELPLESELTLMKLVCERSIAQVQSASGKLGWTPVDSLQSHRIYCVHSHGS